MENIKRILFVAENVTLAHVTRLLVLAEALDKSKYEIHFATGEQAIPYLKSTPFISHTIPTLSSETFIARLAKGHRIYTYTELDASVQADLSFIKEIAPDLIIGDFRISLGISAPLLSIPYISIVNAHWSPYSTADIPLPEHPMVRILGVNCSKLIFNLLKPLIFSYHCLPFNQLRTKYGLKPLKSLQEAYTYGDWTFYADIPELAPTSSLPCNHQYIGPILWSPKVPLPDWWDTVIRDDRPIIYITLGSSGNIKIVDLILDILSKLPVVIILTTANRFLKTNPADNIFLASYLPGEKVAEIASLVICNGGSATAYQALAQGKPVLGFPANTDQHFTMNAISQEGAGLLIRSDQISGIKIKQAIEALLSNPSYRNHAERIKILFSTYNAPTTFSQFIDSLNQQ